MGHALIGHEADDDLLDNVAADLESLTARLSKGAARSREPGHFQQGDSWAAPQDGEVFVSNDDRPVSGRSSPWGLDTVVRRVGDEVEATVTLRSAHEGAPGRSHGGVVAALLDDVFGFLLSIDRTPAFTGELTVRYVRATPLHVPLRCRVRIDSREDRKIFMSGELTEPDGEVCTRAKATFIAIDPVTVPEWGDGV